MSVIITMIVFTQRPLIQFSSLWFRQCHTQNLLLKTLTLIIIMMRIRHNLNFIKITENNKTPHPLDFEHEAFMLDLHVENRHVFGSYHQLHNILM